MTFAFAMEMFSSKSRRAQRVVGIGVQSRKRLLRADENTPKLITAVSRYDSQFRDRARPQPRGTYMTERKNLPTYPAHRIYYLSTDLKATSAIIHFNILLQLRSRPTFRSSFAWHHYHLSRFRELN